MISDFQINYAISILFYNSSYICCVFHLLLENKKYEYFKLNLKLSSIYIFIHPPKFQSRYSVGHLK